MNVGHSLRGLCGLKSVALPVPASLILSQPARAVWIEMKNQITIIKEQTAQPARAVWIEIILDI